MDLRTLLLARTHTVVLDSDGVANAATRPARDADFDKFEDALAQLGFIMSLDLAMTIRRLPHQANQELQAWVLDTLVGALGARPVVPAATGLPTASPYLRRVATWLRARPEQPCPWCGRITAIAPLDPCGHLVCQACWQGGTYAGCPVCHRRVAVGDPFVRLDALPAAPIAGTDGQLRLLHLGFDLVGAARARFAALVTQATPLAVDDRAELESVIDNMGPKAAAWLPARIATRETMAIAVARLWMVAADRAAMLAATATHLRTATDVLRVAVVLMGGDAALATPTRLRSISRGLRRAVLDALDRLPAEPVVEEVRGRAALWKRIGERLHPYEYAEVHGTASLLFAVVRGTKLPATRLGDVLRTKAAACASLQITDELRVRAWVAPGEDALRRGDPAAAVAHLVARPDELLRRIDHVMRALLERPADRDDALSAIRTALSRGAPASLLLVASHLALRGATWPRRVMFPRGSRTWTTPDTRRTLDAETIAALTTAIHGELVARAEARRVFARAVIDRGLADRLLPIGAVRRWGRAVEASGRPTLWDVACVHAAARANVVYVRARDGAIAAYRRRDGEPTGARLARVIAGVADDGKLTAIPAADAPTWFAVLTSELAIPKGSAGIIVDAEDARLKPATAMDLVAELAAKS